MTPEEIRKISVAVIELKRSVGGAFEKFIESLPEEAKKEVLDPAKTTTGMLDHMGALHDERFPKKG